MIKPQTVLIYENATGDWVEATLTSPMTREQIDETASTWTRQKMKARGRRLTGEEDESAIWNWSGKVTAAGADDHYKSFGITYGGQLQGAMLIRTDGVMLNSRERDNAAVYISYIETAPWNRADLTPAPRFAGIGSAFMLTAAGISRAIGFEGRLALHSLRSSEKFYRRKSLRLTEIGPDSPHSALIRFELTALDAAELLKR